jgi:two-component system, response regulator
MRKALRIVDVLLVEDTETDAELCIRTLKKQDIAVEIVWLKDGTEAIDYLFGISANAEPRAMPKFILLDLHLPKIPGLEILRQIRQDHRTKHIPVVVLTSSKEDRDIDASYDHGVSSYVSKPVKFDAFAETIRRLGSYWLTVNRPHSGTGRSRYAGES